MKRTITTTLAIIATTSFLSAGVRYSDPKEVSDPKMITSTPQYTEKKELKNWYFGAGFIGGIQHAGKAIYNETHPPGIPDYEADMNLRSGNYLGGELKLGHRFYFTDAWFVAAELNPYYLTGKLKGSGHWNDNIGDSGTWTYKDDVNKINAMVNMLIGYDFNNFRIYAGPGFGASYIDTANNPDVTFTNQFGTVVNSGKTDGFNPKPAIGLAVQGVAGAEYKFNSSWSVYGEYKYLDVVNAKQKQGPVIWRNDQHRSSLGSIGVKFSF